MKNLGIERIFGFTEEEFFERGALGCCHDVSFQQLAEIIDDVNRLFNARHWLGRFSVAERLLPVSRLSILTWSARMRKEQAPIPHVSRLASTRFACADG